MTETHRKGVGHLGSDAVDPESRSFGSTSDFGFSIDQDPARPNSSGTPTFGPTLQTSDIADPQKSMCCRTRKSKPLGRCSGLTKDGTRCRRPAKMSGTCWQHANIHIATPLTAIECPVCMETCRRPTKLRCGHSFHLDCIAKWAESGGRSCPCCRSPFDLEDLEEEWRPRRALVVHMMSRRPSLRLRGAIQRT